MASKIEQFSLNEIWANIEETLNANPEPFANENLVYQFDLSGNETGVYQLSLQNGKAKVEQGETNEAQCTLTLSTDDFKKLLTGNLNSTMAYMTGKLKVKGSLGLALKMESMLKKYTF